MTKKEEVEDKRGKEGKEEMKKGRGNKLIKSIKKSLRVIKQ